MSSLHLKYMDSIIHQPIYVIRREFQKGQRLREEIEEFNDIDDSMPPFIYELEEENMIVQGESISAYRVYVITQDSKDYYQTGYIASYEIDSCTICKKKFGFMTHKHHCRGCGIVVCQACRPQK